MKFSLLLISILFFSCNPKQNLKIVNTSNIIGLKDSKKILLVDDLKPKSVIRYEKWIEYKPDIKDWDLKGSNVSILDSKFKIGVFDKNENGNYDDIGVDILFVTQYDSEFTQYTPSISSSVSMLKESSIIEIDENLFKVTLGADKKELFISSINKSTVKPDIIYVTKLPSLQVKQLDGQLMNIKDIYLNTPIRLEFWAPHCMPCIDRMIELSNQRPNDEYKTILMLAEGDLKNAKSILNTISVSFPCLISNPRINRLFNQNGYPFEVLIDSLSNIQYDY